MRTVRTGPTTGLIGQFALLAAIAGTTGLGAAGWLAGLAYGVISCALLDRGLLRSGADTLGPADRVTLGRSTLVGGVTALTVDSFTRPTSVAALVALAGVALALDAVDGQVARRTGTCSALGARFDMEVDAFLLLVLSVYVARPMGGWVLAIGAMRYAYVAATWLLPWMSGTLPPRFWRKVVAAVQGIVLVFAMADVLPRTVLIVAVLASLALLVESFGRDVGWLWIHRPIQATARPARQPIPVGTSSTLTEPATVAALAVETPAPTPAPAIATAGAGAPAGRRRGVRRVRRKAAGRRWAAPTSART